MRTKKRPLLFWGRRASVHPQQQESGERPQTAASLLATISAVDHAATPPPDASKLLATIHAPPERAAAAKALCQLSMEESNREAIVAAGGVGLLVRLCESAEAEDSLRLMAVGTLANLARSVGCHAAILREGGIERLAILANRSHGPIEAAALGALCNLAQSAALVPAILKALDADASLGSPTDVTPSPCKRPDAPDASVGSPLRPFPSFASPVRFDPVRATDPPRATVEPCTLGEPVASPVVSPERARPTAEPTPLDTPLGSPPPHVLGSSMGEAAGDGLLTAGAEELEAMGIVAAPLTAAEASDGASPSSDPASSLMPSTAPPPVVATSRSAGAGGALPSWLLTRALRHFLSALPTMLSPLRHFSRLGGGSHQPPLAALTALADPSAAATRHVVCGFLMKKAQRFPWNWRNRYCVFHPPSGTLRYYASAEDAAAGVKLKGQVDRLTALRRVDGEFGLLFEGTRQLLARASSVEERERWECAVQRAIQQGAAATAA